MPLHPDRHLGHKYMGTPDMCDHLGGICGGRGWYEDEGGDRYCDCPCGEERRRVDNEDDK